MVARAEQEQRDLRAEIRKVLTPEQQQRFDRWLEAAPRGRGGRGRGGPR
jgi:Spy/CpxP family protein refolding chaperone